MSWKIIITSDANGQIDWQSVGSEPGILVATVLDGVLATARGLIGQVHTGLTIPCPDAPAELPDGWEATLDGVSVQLDLGTGTQSFSRTYQCGEVVVSAPCRADGQAVAETVAVLNTHTAEQPAAEA